MRAEESPNGGDPGRATSDGQGIVPGNRGEDGECPLIVPPETGIVPKGQPNPFAITPLRAEFVGLPERSLARLRRRTA